MALNNSGFPIETFKQWSQLSPKYNENYINQMWNKLYKKDRQTFYNINTIFNMAKEHNPEEYYQIVTNWRTIDIPFTPNLQINERFIPENFYTNNFTNYDIIALKSNMFSGKTFSIPTLFESYKSIIVVYHRISLNKAIFEKWKQYGFELYSDIKTQTIRLDDHPRIIIQLDSIHRILGKCDLFLADEIESTISHLCGSKYITKTHECCKYLLNYIKHSPKVIICDANLQNSTIDNLIPQYRSTIKIENTFKTFSNTKCTIYQDSNQAIDKLLSLVDQNKRIVIPTNSKKKAKQLKKLILKRNPNLTIFYKDSDIKSTDLNWENFDICIYTPSITAGISFDILHYHTVFGFFVRNSCDSESVSQMLFRVRKLIDNELYIYCDADLQTDGKPCDDLGIENYLNTIINIGNSHLKLDGLDIDSFNGQIEDNQYYKLFKTFIKKSHLSFNYFSSYLNTILKNHGIQTFFQPFSKDKKMLEEIKQQIKEEDINIQNEEIQNIIDAVPIDKQEYDLYKKNTIDITSNIKYSMQKYNICKTFDISQRTNLTIDWIKNRIKYIKGYKNLKFYKQFTIDDCITMLEEDFKNKYNNLIINTYENIKNTVAFKRANNVEIDSSEEDKDIKDSDEEDDDDDFQFEKDYKKKVKCLERKKVTNSLVHNSIHYKKDDLKLIHCFKFLKEAGFTTLDFSEKVQLDYTKLHSYCRTKELELRCLFDARIINWNTELDDNEKRSLTKFINTKLEHYLAVKITNPYKGSKKYSIVSIVDRLEDNIIEDE